jgi:hypothetical protein
VLFVDTEVDWSKAEDVIAQARQKALMLKDEEGSLHREFEDMKLKSGNFWLKPILHPSVPISYDNPILIVKPCGFYCRGFHSLI